MRRLQHSITTFHPLVYFFHTSACKNEHIHYIQTNVYQGENNGNLFILKVTSENFL